MSRNAMTTNFVITILEDQVVFVVTTDTATTVQSVSKKTWYPAFSFLVTLASLEGRDSLGITSSQIIFLLNVSSPVTTKLNLLRGPKDLCHCTRFPLR